VQRIGRKCVFSDDGEKAGRIKCSSVSIVEIMQLLPQLIHGLTYLPSETKRTIALRLTWPEKLTG
jgi:hypothetical protein